MRRELLWVCSACTIWGWLSAPSVTGPPDNFQIEIRMRSSMRGDRSLSLCREANGQVFAEIHRPLLFSHPERLSGTLPTELAAEIWTDLRPVKSVNRGKLERILMDHTSYDLRLISGDQEVQQFSSAYCHGEGEVLVIEAIGRAERLVLEQLRAQSSGN